MPPRPHNHVTAHLEALRGSHRVKALPEVPEDLLLALEEEYPARCYTGTEESLEDHLRYAGAVQLVASLRQAFERQREAGLGVEPPEDDDT